MNATFRTAHALALAGWPSSCGPSSPNDTVELLTAHPERIKEIQRLCREDCSKVSDELCLRAAEAAKRRFFGDLADTSHPVNSSPRRACPATGLLHTLSLTTTAIDKDQMKIAVRRILKRISISTV